VETRHLTAIFYAEPDWPMRAMRS